MAEMGLVASIQPFVGWKGGVARRMTRPTYADNGEKENNNCTTFVGCFLLLDPCWRGECCPPLVAIETRYPVVVFGICQKARQLNALRFGSTE